MKKILIHTLIFGPDGVSTAYLYNDIALAFKKAGYDVVVLTTTPHFNAVPEQIAEQPLKWGCWGLYKKSSFHGIPVYHVAQRKFKSTALRVLGFTYWHIVSFLIALFMRKIDVILSPSPPLTIGRLNNWLGWLKRCKVVYNVQEIYPDIMGLKPTSVVHRYFRGMEQRVYNASDAVTTIDQVFYDTIAPRFKNRSKLHIIPNFVDTELYNPDADVTQLDEKLFPKTTSKKVMYAGNVGYAQDWDTFISVAKKTKDEDIEYFVIGKGVTKKLLMEEVEKEQLTKVHILDYQPRALMPALLAYSDAQFIFMSEKMQKQGFPSKVYTIMACARPLLIGADDGTPLVNFLNGKGCAKIVTDKDLEEKSTAMAEWLVSTTKEEMRRMGEMGLQEIKQNYTTDIVTQKYVELVNDILA